jgi:hypothetical protein
VLLLRHLFGLYLYSNNRDEKEMNIITLIVLKVEYKFNIVEYIFYSFDRNSHIPSFYDFFKLSVLEKNFIKFTKIKYLFRIKKFFLYQ